MSSFGAETMISLGKDSNSGWEMVAVPSPDEKTEMFDYFCPEYQPFPEKYWRDSLFVEPPPVEQPWGLLNLNYFRFFLQQEELKDRLLGAQVLRINNFTLRGEKVFVDLMRVILSEGGEGENSDAEILSGGGFLGKFRFYIALRSRENNTLLEGPALVPSGVFRSWKLSTYRGELYLFGMCDKVSRVDFCVFNYQQGEFKKYPIDFGDRKLDFFSVLVDDSTGEETLVLADTEKLYRFGSISGTLGAERGFCGDSSSAAKPKLCSAERDFCGDSSSAAKPELRSAERGFCGQAELLFETRNPMGYCCCGVEIFRDYHYNIWILAGYSIAVLTPDLRETLYCGNYFRWLFFLDEDENPSLFRKEEGKYQKYNVLLRKSEI